VSGYVPPKDSEDSEPSRARVGASPANSLSSLWQSRGDRGWSDERRNPSSRRASVAPATGSSTRGGYGPEALDRLGGRAHKLPPRGRLFSNDGPPAARRSASSGSCPMAVCSKPCGTGWTRCTCPPCDCPNCRARWAKIGADPFYPRCSLDGARVVEPERCPLCVVDLGDGTCPACATALDFARRPLGPVGECGAEQEATFVTWTSYEPDVEAIAAGRERVRAFWDERDWRPTCSCADGGRGAERCERCWGWRT
jgi:hypothetical protein